MSVSWLEFLPGVAIDVKGCPRAVMLDYIRRAAIYFCNDTRILRTTLDPVAVTAGTSGYALPVPAGRSIVAPVDKSGRFDSNAIAGPVDVNGLTPGATGPVDRWAILSDKTIELWPTPSVDGVFTCSAYLAPTPSAADCDDLLFNYWREAIEARAKQSLLSMPDKAWSDPGAAQSNQIEYRRLRSRARAQVIRQGRTSLRVHYRQLGD